MDPKVPFAAILDLTKPFLLGYALAGVFIGVSVPFCWVSAPFLTVFVNPEWAPESNEAPEPVINEEVSLAVNRFEQDYRRCNLFLFGLSWWGLAVYPLSYVGGAERKCRPEHERGGRLREFPGGPNRGIESTTANGCVLSYPNLSATKAKVAILTEKWGKRRTVARDYMQDGHVFLGVSRFGPDLTNVGVRKRIRSGFIGTYTIRAFLIPRPTDAVLSVAIPTSRLSRVNRHKTL